MYEPTPLLGVGVDRARIPRCVWAVQFCATDPQPRTVPETECSRWVEGSYYLDIMYYEVNTAGTFPYFVLYVLKLY